MSPPTVYPATHPRYSFLVHWKNTEGKVQKRYFKKQGDARRYANKITLTLAKVGEEGIEMGDVARSQWREMAKLLEAHGITPLEAVRAYVSGKTVTLAKAERPSLAEAIKQFVQGKENRGKSSRTVSSLKSRLKVLSGLKGWDDCTSEKMESLVFLGGSPRSKINKLTVLSGFFSWAVKKQFCGNNPIQSIDKPETEASAPKIVSVQQMEILLENAKSPRFSYVSYYAILGFAGLRPSELNGILANGSFQNCVKDGEIIVSGVGKKNKSSRTVQLCPKLQSILESGKWDVKIPTPKNHRLLLEKCGWAIKRKKHDRKLEDEAKRGGGAPKQGEWQEDILRHSFVSYRLAILKDKNKVANESGHSVAVLNRFYNFPVTKTDAQKYFGES